MFDDMIRKRREKLKRTIKKGASKLGRSWKKIAHDFCDAVIEIIKEQGTPEITILGSAIREIVPDPNNKTFRSICKENGITITKVSRSDIYTVSATNYIEWMTRKKGGMKW